MREAVAGRSLKALPAAERLAFLADFAAQIAGVADGGKVVIKVRE